MRTYQNAPPQRPHRRRMTMLAVFAMLTTLLIPAFATAAQAQAATCDGVPVTVDLNLGQVPTAGSDVILGTDGDDLIAAMGGDDLICGLGGNDKIWGQGGFDFILGGDGDDRLRGGADGDVLLGGPGVDNLAGGTGDDFVIGGPGNDELLRGGTGDDLLDGEEGDDLLVAGNGGEDSVFGGPGNDKVTGGPRPDILAGDVGNDELRGNKGADYIEGGPGDDEIFGGPQPDDIDGGDGADDCNGGTTGDGAPEDDNAVNCETESNIEGANVEVPEGALLPQEIGSANIGGEVVNPMQAEILSLAVLESLPEQLQITFQGPPLACLAADAVAIADGGSVFVLVFVGSPVDGPDACAAVLETHTITIALTEPLDGREIVTPPPFEEGSGPETFDFETLGPELDVENLFGVPVSSVETIVGPPDQLAVTFSTGPVSCFAAEVGVFGFPDRIEVFAVSSPRTDVPEDTVCPAILETYTLTVTLSSPIAGRPILVPPPIDFDDPSTIPGSTAQNSFMFALRSAQAHSWGR